METMKARGGAEIQCYSYRILDSKWGLMVNVMPRPHYHWK